MRVKANEDQELIDWSEADSVAVYPDAEDAPIDDDYAEVLAEIESSCGEF